MDRLLQLEQQISSLQSILDASAKAHPVAPMQQRLARTVAGSAAYPTEPANTFHIEFLDQAYARTPGEQTPTVLVRTGQEAIVHNVTGGYIDEGVVITVWEWGGYWWTASGGAPEEKPEVLPTANVWVVAEVYGQPQWSLIGPSPINEGEFVGSATYIDTSGPGPTFPSYQASSHSAWRYNTQPGTPSNVTKAELLFRQFLPQPVDTVGTVFPSAGVNEPGTAWLRSRIRGVDLDDWQGFQTTDFSEWENLWLNDSTAAEVSFDREGILASPYGPEVHLVANITTIYEEITSRPGWNPGNHIGILWRDENSDWDYNPEVGFVEKSIKFGGPVGEFRLVLNDA